MIGELRDLSLTVARCSAAIEMPDVIAARDDLVERFVRAAIAPRPSSVPTPRFPDVDDVNELPLYYS